jgi:hypothetical protein
MHYFLKDALPLIQMEIIGQGPVKRDQAPLKVILHNCQAEVRERSSAKIGGTVLSCIPLHLKLCAMLSENKMNTALSRKVCQTVNP